MTGHNILVIYLFIGLILEHLSFKRHHDEDECDKPRLWAVPYFMLHYHTIRSDVPFLYLINDYIV